MRLFIALLSLSCLAAAPAVAQALDDAQPAAPPASQTLDKALTTPPAPLLPLPPKHEKKPARKSVKKAEKNDLQADNPKIDALQPALAAPENNGEGEKTDLFTTALVSVYNTHPQLKAQREAQKATDENVNLAVSSVRPDIRGGYSWGRLDTDKNTNSRSKTATYNATQPLFVGGALSGIKSAKQRVAAGQAQLVAVEQQVLYDAVVAYCNVVNQLAVLQVNQNNVDLLDRQFLATKARFQVGDNITRTDLAQAQARLALAKASERTALGNLDVARATFARVIGFDAPEALSLPPEPAGLPDTLDVARQQAGANEPTLGAAIELEKASKSEVSVYKGAILPSLNATAQRRDVQGNTAGGQNSLTNDSFLLNLTVPLYQSGAEYARVRQAKDLAEQAHYNAIDTRNAVIENVTQTWQNYVTAKQVIQSNEEAVRAAKTAMNSIQQENKYGARSILDVLNTQQDMFNSQVNLVNARVAERQAAYRLLAAVGRLTAQSLHLPVDINDPKQHYDDVKYKLIGF